MNWIFQNIKLPLFVMFLSSQALASGRPMGEKLPCSVLSKALSAITAVHPDHVVLDSAMTKEMLNDLPSELDSLNLGFWSEDIQKFFRNPDDGVINSIHMAMGNIEMYSDMNEMLGRSYNRIKTVVSAIEKSKNLKADILARSLNKEKFDKWNTTAPIENQTQWEERWRDVLTAQFLFLKNTGNNDNEAFVLAIRSVKRAIESDLEKWAMGINFYMLNEYLQSTSPHSRAQYVNPVKDLENLPTGLIGIRTGEAVLGVSVREIVDGMPGQAAGLQVGDIITHIRTEEKSPWVKLYGKSANDSLIFIRGEPDSMVTLRILRGKEILEKTIKRAGTPKTETETVTGKVLRVDNKNIGVLKINSFGEAGIAGLASDQLDKFKEQSVDGVVLDLRGNRGGLVSEAIGLLGLFVGNEKLGYIVMGEGISTMNAKTKEIKWTGPLAVLVDMGSASASELTAIAIKDLDRGIVVGGPYTFGKGTSVINEKVDIERPTAEPNAPKIPDDKVDFFRVTTTHGRFYGPRGSTPQFTGVIPHIALPVLGRNQPIMEFNLKHSMKKLPFPIKLETPKSFIDRRELRLLVHDLSADMVKRVLGSEKWTEAVKTGTSASDLWLEETANILNDWLKRKQP